MRNERLVRRGGDSPFGDLCPKEMTEDWLRSQRAYGNVGVAEMKR